MTHTAPNSSEATQTQPDSQNPPKKFNPRLAIPIVLVIGAIGYGIWTILPKPAETVLHISGRLESDETDIAIRNDL